VKKIISILVALGLVLGLTVMATPVMAQPGVTNLQVAVDLPVALETTCYNITFTATNALSYGQWIRVTFPAGTDLTAVGVGTVTVNGTVPANVNNVGPTGIDVQHNIAAGIPAGCFVEVYICAVANAPAGAYTMTVITETDTEPVTASFTIAGPTITSIIPDHGNQGETLDVIITGTNFDGATEVTFDAQITVNIFNVDNSTQITAGITIDQMCAPQPTTIFVTTPAGTATLEDGFTVEPEDGCFIATAAYGTPMAEEIEILREFRDEYLLTSPLGRALVDLYYRVSPPMAEFITEHPSLKPIVRAGLLPAVAVSAVAVNTTPAEKMAIVGLVGLVSVTLAAWATRQRGRGPQYT